MTIIVVEWHPEIYIFHREIAHELVYRYLLVSERVCDRLEERLYIVVRKTRHENEPKSSRWNAGREKDELLERARGAVDQHKDQSNKTILDSYQKCKV